MSRKMKKVILSLLVIFFLASCIYNYVMYGGARNLEDEKVDFTITSKELIKEYTNNIEISNKKYLEKAVAVTGNITSVDKNEVVIDNSVFCVLQDSTVLLTKNKTITLKGRIVGYDDLMGEVKIDKCFIVK